MTSPTYRDVLTFLAKASLPVRELQGRGHVAVALPAGRIIAMAFSREGLNLMWSNPQLARDDLMQKDIDQLVGGIGGDRLWFAPEVDYHWNGPPRWDTFANYRVPQETDPGSYEFISADRDCITLRAEGQLTSHRTGDCIAFEVRRTVRLTPPPLRDDDPVMHRLEYVGIETSHTLKLDSDSKTGRIDLWHLLQIPAGSVLVVPLKSSAPINDRVPLSYGLQGGWMEKTDHIWWRYTGRSCAKFGLRVSASTGRAAVIRELEPGRHCLIVRQFSVDDNAVFADHPFDVPRTDQVFQAWDGFGFGELEYHSPMLDAQKGPRKLHESDYLWAFSGQFSDVAMLARSLLGVDIADVYRD